MPAFSSYPAAGAKLRASTLQALIAEVRPLKARAGSDQALATASTTLANITDLVVALAATTEYEFELELVASLSSGVTEDIKIGFTWPSGATVDFFVCGPATSMAAGSTAADMNVVANLSAASGSTAVQLGVTTSATVGRIGVRIVTAATAGNLQVQAAQQTSGGNVVTVKAGSLLIGRQTA